MSHLILSDQSIATSKKTKEWHMNEANQNIIGKGTSAYEDQRAQMLKLYRAYNAEIGDSKEDLTYIKTITCPNGIDYGLPFVVYPLIQTKLEQLCGELMMRPMERKSYVIDKRSKNAKFEEKLNMLSEEIMRDLAKKISPELGFEASTENPEMELPPDIEEFFENDFKSMAEQICDNFIELFMEGRKEKHKIKHLFLDYCIVDRCHAVLDKKFGHTTMRKVSPLDSRYISDPYKDVQDDHLAFMENYWMLENDIYNSFNLSKSQKESVRSLFHEIQGDRGKNTDSTYDTSDLGVSSKYDGWIEVSNKVARVRVVHMMWKSRKSIAIKESQNKRGDVFNKKLDEDYQERKSDKIEYIHGEEPRYVYMIGPDLCLEWGLMEQRFSYIETPWYCSLPVLSLIRDNYTGSSLIKSPAAKLLPLQEIASELLYELRLALKHIGDSRVLLYDTSQTPKAFSKSAGTSALNRVLHHIKKDKMVAFNSKEKGSSKGFNQFTSIDMSTRGAVKEMFEALAVIEDLAGKFLGIAPEREGQMQKYQTATSVDKAIRGSTARTEVIYAPFDEFVQALLEKVILKAKQDYEKGEVIHYIIGENKSKFLKLISDFFLSDFGIYLADPGRSAQTAERIDMAVERALANSQDPDMVMAYIDVLEGDNASEKKAIYKRALNAMRKMREQQQQIDQQMAQQAMEQEALKRKEDMQKHKETLENNKEVALIYANNKAMTEGMKNQTQKLIKAAEIEQKRLASKDSKQK